MLFCSITALSLPNEKVLSSFSTAFPNADSVQWYDGQHEYNVYFVNDGVKCRAWYSEEGVVKKCIRYYDGTKLPPMVIGNIKSRYPGLTIYGVTEYSTPDEFVYQVTLEDERKWYVVHVDASGHCSLASKLNKTKD